MSIREGFGLLLCVVPLGVFAWLFWPSSKKRDPDAPDESFLDPDDPRQLGTLVGLSGGSVADAAQLRFALERFQELHGRRATTRDIATVLGLVK